MKRFAALLVLLAACGSGVGDDTTTTTTATTTVPTTIAPATSVATTTTSTAETVVVDVYFGITDPVTCSEVESYRREIPADIDRIQGALTALLAGPTDDEVAAGASSFFGPETAVVVVDVSLEGGAATVDFSDFSQIIPNASSSCGSASLIAQLTETVFQFTDVESVTYTFGGSCEAFGEFVQTGCVTIDRSDWPPTGSSALYAVGENVGWVPEPFAGSDGANGSGCAPGIDGLPDGAWFGVMRSVDADSIGFDLACWFGGEAANEAAAEDGETEIPLPNDYYIRNDSDALRDVPVAGDAIAFRLTDDPATFDRLEWPAWVADPTSGFLMCPGEFCLVWIYINDGELTELVTQYVP